MTKRTMQKLEDIGFELKVDCLEYTFRMYNLKIVVMPLNTFVLEIWNKGKLINGQRLNISSFKKVKQFIDCLDFERAKNE